LCSLTRLLLGKYFDNISPIDGSVLCQAARSTAADVESALDAAHAAFPGWSNTSVAERSNVMLKMADLIEQNTERLALIEVCIERVKEITFHFQILF